MRTIPKKNYIILAIILVVTLGLLYYFYLWYSAYNKSSLETGIMNEYVGVINYNEINSYVLENRKVYIYASFLKDNKIRKFELKFKNDLIKDDLTNKILYLDLTSELKSGRKLNYGLSKEMLPCILVFNNGILVNHYDIKNSGYSSEKTVAYLVSEGIEDNA